MTAPELLAEVEARGGSVAVALDATGAAMLKVTPRGIVPDLLPDLARFKPALLELLADDDIARQRVRPELARRMDADFDDYDDVIALGRLLLKLDAGEEIE
jgi:hypothetical protein